MSLPTRENAPHLDTGSSHGPTPADDHGEGRPPPATERRAREHQWPSTRDLGDRTRGQPPVSSTASLDLAVSPVSTLATLPEVPTAREAAAILRVGHNQLYQAIARGELGAVRIGRSIRILKQALLELLAAASTTASGDE